MKKENIHIIIYYGIVLIIMGGLVIFMTNRFEKSAKHEIREYNFEVKEVFPSQGYWTSNKTILKNLITGEVRPFLGLWGSKGDMIQCNGRFYFESKSVKLVYCVSL